MGEAAIKGLARERQKELRAIGTRHSRVLPNGQDPTRGGPRRSTVPVFRLFRQHKKAEAATEVEWLSQIARIAKGDHLETVTTEEYDPVGNLKTRTTRTTTSRPAWQAYAWLLERRHPEKWARTERPPAADGPGTLDPEDVIAPGEAQKAKSHPRPPIADVPGARLLQRTNQEMREDGRRRRRAR